MASRRAVPYDVCLKEAYQSLSRGSTTMVYSGAIWCIVMRKRRPRTGQAAPVRLSISVPHEHHAKLEQMASEKGVSLARVVRDAIEQYVTGRARLIAPPKDADSKEDR